MVGVGFLFSLDGSDHYSTNYLETLLPQRGLGKGCDNGIAQTRRRYTQGDFSRICLTQTLSGKRSFHFRGISAKLDSLLLSHVTSYSKQLVNNKMSATNQGLGRCHDGYEHLLCVHEDRLQFPNTYVSRQMWTCVPVTLALEGT